MHTLNLFLKKCGLIKKRRAKKEKKKKGACEVLYNIVYFFRIHLKNAP